MRVVFFGSPAAALPSLAGLLEAGHAVELVITQPDRPSGRSRRPAAGPVKEFAVRRGLPLLQPEKIRKEPVVLEALRTVNADIHVVVAYGQILPLAIIDLPRHKSVNVHFSLLPKYRGAAPVQAALLNGEMSTGVTIFRLNERMDEGDILTTALTEIRPGENAGGLETRLAEIGASLLLETLSRLESYPHRPQNPAEATLAPKLHKDDGRLDWTRDALRIDRTVRAFTPWPSAFTFFKGRRLIILKGLALERGPAVGTPGTILGISKEGVDIACGGGTVYRIVRLQPENKKAMEAHAFSLSGRLRLSEILG